MRCFLNNKKAREGVAVLLLGLALGVRSLLGFRRAAVRTSWILSPWLFPLLLAVFAVLLAAALLAESRAGAGEEEKTPAPGALTALAVVLISAACAALLPWLHFIPAGALYLAALLLLLGERRPWMLAALSLLTPLLLYALFALALGVRLP